MDSAREISWRRSNRRHGIRRCPLLATRQWGSGEVRSTPSGTVWIVVMGDDADDRKLERVITPAFAEHVVTGDEGF
jgi:hypothetical protein